MSINLWPHQNFGVEQTLSAISAGERRICLTSPTGGGKTAIACDLIDHWLDHHLKVAVYTNRKLLVEQTSRVLTAHGIDHGTRAAGYDQGDDQFFPVQICSLQTEQSRVYRQGYWQLHDADRVLVDEAHVQKGETARKILQAHYEEGAAYVGLTATPLDLGDLYDHLIIAGTTSELRECGALVWADHYAPDEPDLRELKKLRIGEDLSEAQNHSAMMRPGLFGRVYDHWRRLNPEGKPTILFAPDVAGSRWFAEQFYAQGVSAAHIDGQEVWHNGTLTRTSKEARAAVLEASRTGKVRILCNRFVLREGVDAPWLQHGILATVFGSLQSYLQSGGRLLRAHPGMEKINIQDHGGNYWRHGSLNADREWSLDLTGPIVTGLREDAMRNKTVKEPTVCPQCKLVLHGSRCRLCGYEIPLKGKSREVVQSDGTLKHQSGDLFNPRRISKQPNGPDLWAKMYHRSRTKRGERTFRAAMALFAYENNWLYPDPKWPFMPTDPMDHFRLVAEVPMERLVPKQGVLK